MKGKILNKEKANIMVIVLTVSYWGILANVTYATYEELEKQKTQTDHFESISESELMNIGSKRKAKDISEFLEE